MKTQEQLVFSEGKTKTTIIRLEEATPGFYKTVKGGHIVKVVLRSKVSSRWPMIPSSNWIPYKIAANPESKQSKDRVAVYGWLPPYYQVEPALIPDWWNRQALAASQGLSEFRASSEAAKIKHIKTCRTCGRTGHNTATCPKNPSNFPKTRKVKKVTEEEQKAEAIRKMQELAAKIAQTGDKEVRKCKKCGKIGHNIRTCKEVR